MHCCWCDRLTCCRKYCTKLQRSSKPALQPDVTFHTCSLQGRQQGLLSLGSLGSQDLSSFCCFCLFLLKQHHLHTSNIVEPGFEIAMTPQLCSPDGDWPTAQACFQSGPMLNQCRVTQHACGPAVLEQLLLLKQYPFRCCCTFQCTAFECCYMMCPRLLASAECSTSQSLIVVAAAKPYSCTGLPLDCLLQG